MGLYTQEQEQAVAQARGGDKLNLSDIPHGTIVVAEITRLISKIKDTPRGPRKQITAITNILSKEFFGEELLINLLLEHNSFAEKRWNNFMIAIDEARLTSPLDAIGKTISFEVIHSEYNGKTYANIENVQKYTKVGEPLMSHSTKDLPDEIPF